MHTESKAPFSRLRCQHHVLAALVVAPVKAQKPPSFRRLRWKEVEKAQGLSARHSTSPRKRQKWVNKTSLYWISVGYGNIVNRV